MSNPGRVRIVDILNLLICELLRVLIYVVKLFSENTTSLTADAVFFFFLLLEHDHPRVRLKDLPFKLSSMMCMQYGYSYRG
jgi:hypothetical protein